MAFDPQRQRSTILRVITCAARSVRFNLRGSWRISFASSGNISPRASVGCVKYINAQSPATPPPTPLVHSPRFAIHVIHQQVLAEIIWRRKVRLASAQLRDFLHEIHQPEIAREHEGVDQDALLLAAADFFKR